MNRKIIFTAFLLSVASIWSGVFHYSVTMGNFFQRYNLQTKVFSSSWMILTVFGVIFLSRNWKTATQKERLLLVAVGSYAILSTLTFGQAIIVNSGS